MKEERYIPHPSSLIPHPFNESLIPSRLSQVFCMRRTRISKYFALASALVLLALTGCSGNLTRVTGQLVENGQPRALDEGEHVQIDFVSGADAPRPLSLGVFVKRNGSFVADMNDGSGRGILPGKYKVRLNGEGTSLKTKANTKLFRETVPVEVAQGTPTRLTIDLSQGTIAP
jgi:hypothetical protein